MFRRLPMANMVSSIAHCSALPLISKSDGLLQRADHRLEQGSSSARWQHLVEARIRRRRATHTSVKAATETYRTSTLLVLRPHPMFLSAISTARPNRGQQDDPC